MSARMQAGLLFLATIALLIPSQFPRMPIRLPAWPLATVVSVVLAVLLSRRLWTDMLYSLKTHRGRVVSAETGAGDGERP